jgi:hypothetical protein
MKTILCIDVDTEREYPINFSKPSGFAEPTTPEEAKEMIMNDIASVCEGLCVLISVADQNQYATKESLVSAAFQRLNSVLLERPTSDSENTQNTENTEGQ